MATKNNKTNRPSVGFYDEPGFVSLTTSLRKISGDDTIPTDSYVDIQKDIYDLITPDIQITKGGIIDIILNNTKDSLIIYYADGTINTLKLNDNTLFKVYYENISNTIYFVLKDGTKLTLDLNFLLEMFSSKQEMIETQNKVNNLETKVNIIEKSLNDGIDKINWQYF